MIQGLAMFKIAFLTHSHPKDMNTYIGMLQLYVWNWRQYSKTLPTLTARTVVSEWSSHWPVGIIFLYRYCQLLRDGFVTDNDPAQLPCFSMTSLLGPNHIMLMVQSFLYQDQKSFCVTYCPPTSLLEIIYMQSSWVPNRVSQACDSLFNLGVRFLILSLHLKNV